MLTRLRLQRRATARLRLWPQAIVDDVLEYFRSSEARFAGPAARRDPFWLELPRWLARSPRFRRTRRVDSRFLSDVTWGQYCLFLYARIRDDERRNYRCGCTQCQRRTADQMERIKIVRCEKGIAHS